MLNKNNDTTTNFHNPTQEETFLTKTTTNEYAHDHAHSVYRTDTFDIHCHSDDLSSRS